MVLDAWLTGIERRLAARGLPAGPDHLINHKVILGVLAGSLGAVIGWVLTEPYGEDFGFWKDFLILSVEGFFICLLIMSAETVFDRDFKAFKRSLVISAVYTFAIIVPTVLAVKLILKPAPPVAPETVKVLVLDTSGSMEGYPLETLKKALNVYLDTIDKVGARGRTSVACVAFDTYAQVISQPTTDYDSLRTSVDRLQASGVTNMPAALDAARSILSDKGSSAIYAANKASAEVILVSDGRPLIRQPAAMTLPALEEVVRESVQATKQCLPFFEGNRIPLNTVGAGKDYDADLLKDISTRTHGTFAQADEVSTLIPVLKRFAERGLTGASHSGRRLSPLSRILGWTLAGIAIGICSSFLRRSSIRKLLDRIPLPEVSRRTLLFAGAGGLVGGFSGALLFEIIQYIFGLLDITSGTVNRLVGFLILGACVGFFVNLVQSAAKKAWIRITRGAGEGKLFVLDRWPMILGRSEMVDIPVFGDLSIEPQNLLFSQNETGIEAETLGQDNFSINGTKTRKAMLQHNDVFTVGNTGFIYLNKLQRIEGSVHE